MQHSPANRKITRFIKRMLCFVLPLAVLFSSCSAVSEEAFTASTFAMDTLVNQTAYGPNAKKAMQEVNTVLAGLNRRLSLFEKGSDIARINAAAGKEDVEVAGETAALLQKSKQLSAQSEGAFALTIAPLTLAWGVNSDSPRVVPDAERESLLPLVADDELYIEGNRIKLGKEGMGIDLGGIAKGEACDVARGIYEKYGVESALLDLGNSTIYALGAKPGGSAFRIGFRDPGGVDGAYIGSFTLQNEAVAVSGGYERFFEKDGKRYIHIIDPRTGMPAESDIASVAVFSEDGITADFYSTTLFVWGKQRTLRYMEEGGRVILLDNENTLYVSQSLKEDFTLNEGLRETYKIEYVEDTGR